MICSFRVVAIAMAMLTTAALSTPVAAQDAEDSSRFGIGFQSSWPSYGISGLYDLSDVITLQAIVGAFGTVTSFGGRGIYRLQNEDKYDLYAFGTAGLWRYDYSVDVESTVGFGGGAGIELDWRRIISPDDDSFPPLFSSIDIGYVVANFDHYNWGGFAMGGGIHYRF